jgi:hypothetical protein
MIQTNFDSFAQIFLPEHAATVLGQCEYVDADRGPVLAEEFLIARVLLPSPGPERRVAGDVI